MTKKSNGALDLDAEKARIVTIGRRLNLSPREAALCALVHDEFEDKQIGDELRMSVHTARNHLRAIFRKLGVKTRAGVSKRWQWATGEAWQEPVRQEPVITARRRKGVRLSA